MSTRGENEDKGDSPAIRDMSESLEILSQSSANPQKKSPAKQLLPLHVKSLMFQGEEDLYTVIFTQYLVPGRICWGWCLFKYEDHSQTSKSLPHKSVYLTSNESEGIILRIKAHGLAYIFKILKFTISWEINKISIWWNITLRKEQNTDGCHNMDESWER